MQARVVVFPVKGRAWCFARPRAIAPAASAGGGDGALPPVTLKDLWRGIAGGGRTASENAESVVDFVADKMNRAWIGFGSAPEGSVKSRIHSFGLKLLSRVRPSEVLLKSVTKDVSMLEIVHPARYCLYQTYHFFGCYFVLILIGELYRDLYFACLVLLVEMTLCHIESAKWKIQYKRVSKSIYSVTSFVDIALITGKWQPWLGSERLQLLVSDCSGQWKILLKRKKETSSRKDGNPCENAQYAPWSLQPSKKLDGFLERRNLDEGLDCDTISSICQAYDLDKIDVLKYRDLE